MRHGKRVLLFALTLFILVSGQPGIGLSAGNVYEIETLRGLEKVNAVVEVVAKDPGFADLREAAKSQVEEKLRLAGIESGYSSVNEIFSVRITIAQTSGPPTPYYLIIFDFSLIQGISLSRNSQIQSVGTTWSASTVAFNVVEDKIGSELTAQIDRFMDAFLRDYLLANSE